jgi:aminopeptidase N
MHKNAILRAGFAGLLLLCCVSLSAQPDTTFDIKFYHLQLTPAIDEPGLKASTRIRFASKTSGLTAITLQLENHLTIDSITGASQKFDRASGNQVKVKLNRTMRIGEEAEIQIYYHGVPHLANNIKGMRWETHGKAVPIIATLSTPFLAHYWYPCKDGPGDKADSVYVDITVPKMEIEGHPLMGVSNGMLDHVSETENTKTFHWRHRYPIVTYYVMMAVSNYRKLSQTYTDPYGNSFPIEHYVFPESWNDAIEGTKELPQVMDEFSRLFGPYPFHKEKYGMTELGFYSGIENQTNVIVNNLGIGDFSTQVHELAHMWFADNLTCLNWHHAWLNESFATYAEALWAEKKSGRKGYREVMVDHSEMETRPVYLHEIDDPFNIFVSRVYYKGSWVLHTLRTVMGDEKFFAALKEYAIDPRFQFAHVIATDFQLICEKHHGASLYDFFQDFIMNEGVPVYALEWKPEMGDKARLVQLQADPGEFSLCRTPIEISVMDAQGRKVTKSYDKTGEITLPAIPSTMPPQIDPGNTRLCMTMVVSNIEKWTKAGAPFFAMDTDYSSHETYIRYLSESDQNGTIEVFSDPQDKSGTVLFKGKWNSDFDALTFENFTSGGPSVLKVKTKEYELWMYGLPAE